MNFIDRVEPELREVLDAIPPDLLDLNDIPGTRVKIAAMFEAMEVPEIVGIESEDH